MGEDFTAGDGSACDSHGAENLPAIEIDGFRSDVRWSSNRQIYA